jgi:hypothetical protein
MNWDWKTPEHKRILELVELGFTIVFVALLIVFKGGTASHVIEITPTGAPQAVNISSSPSATLPPPVDKVVLHATAIDYNGEKILPSNTAKLPDAVRFESFDYDATLGKELDIESTCNDAYYTVLIFSDSTNYKTNPAAAKVNSGHECPANHTVSAKLNLADFNLASGKYYFFLADQGSSGTWYNPR